MRNWINLILGIGLSLIVTGQLPGRSAGESLPNIVFFLADDIGWADPGRYHEHYSGNDAKVPTPNLDRLCDQGMMFLDAQLPAALCAPNRFCIMTGNYTQRSRPWGTWNRTATSAFHFGNAKNDRIDNPHETIGTALKKKGYRTAYLGKMHFGGDFFDPEGNILRDQPNDQLGQIDFSKRFRNGLLDHGFDYTFVTPDGIQGPLYAYFENDLYVPISNFSSEVNGVDVSGDSVLRSFSKGQRVGNGEMIQVGYGDSEFDTSEHGPILSHFAQEFMEEHVANEPDSPFLLYYATPAIHVPLTPSVKGIKAAGHSQIGPRADFVYDLDAQLGLLLDKIRDLGIANNTLIIFTSDNGGAISGGQAQIAAGQDPNGPLRGKKSSIYEGGHRVPMIWKWGDGTRKGSIIPPNTKCEHLVSVIDWVASVIDLTGGKVEEDQHYDSVSLFPLLFSEEPDDLDPVRNFHFYSIGDYRGVRMDDAQGKWFYKRTDGDGKLELFNLMNDLGQTDNLILGYSLITEIPEEHPQKERIQIMENWFNAHKATTSPRTAEALDYSDKNTEGSNQRIISTNFTEYTGDPQRINNGETFGIEELDSVTDGWVNLHKTDQAIELTNNFNEKTNVSLSIKHPNNWGTGNAAYNNTPIKAGVDDFTGTNSPTSITFAGLNATFPDGYRAIVYVGGYLGNRGASISDGNSTFYYQTSASPTAPVTFVQTTTVTDDGDGTAPEAHYVIFGTDESPLLNDSITFTIDTLYGGGSFIGGIQIMGESVPGEPIKTLIPIPVAEPRIEINNGTGSILISDLYPDVSYQLQESTPLGNQWSVIELIESPEKSEIVISNDFLERNSFYRILYPEKVRRLNLPKSLQ
ncbi:MAG: sulfatase-like hydrolase/transferase [Verrucomicrobiota bacterium]|nr:sulfatase-like hydrolase/transferase [Verrucomicrobiota bacterium]